MKTLTIGMLFTMSMIASAVGSDFYEVKCPNGYELKKSGQAKFSCQKVTREEKKYNLGSTDDCSNGLSRDKYWTYMVDNSNQYDQCVKHKSGSRKAGKVVGVKCKIGYDIVPQKGKDQCIKPGKVKTKKPDLKKA